MAALLRKAFTEKDRIACIKAQVTRALAGDTKAFEVLMAYTYGKPKEKVEQSGALTIEVVYVDPPPTP